MNFSEQARTNISSFWKKERNSYRPDDRARALEHRENFGAQISVELANSMRRIAQEQGRPTFCVISEAFEEYVARYVMRKHRENDGSGSLTS